MAPSDDLAALGARIRAGRAALGLTQAALAAQVGCSAEMLRKYEAGAKRPPPALVERLADRFGMTGAARASFLATAPARSPAPPPAWFPRTKLHAPRPRRDLLDRPRLVSLLRGAAGAARLILLTAPAGAGKTTLLSGALADLALPAAWITLDTDDNDPARFFAVLLAACAPLAPGVPAAEAQVLQALRAPQPDRTAPVRRAVAALVNALPEAWPTPGLLVLDDLHAVGEPLVHGALAYLLDHLPAGLTLVVATRHDPPLPLARLRARRELLELRLPELRFTAEETAALLTGPMGLALAPAEIAALHRYTEGWAAGVSLLAASLSAPGPAADRARLIATLATGDRQLFGYLADEVLDRQGPAERDFLLDTAVLPELTGAACRALTGRDDAPAALDALYQRNLFLVALGPERRQGDEAAYRYHDLFRSFLIDRLRRADPARLRDLHRRAAACAADPQRAVEHLLHAELWEAAADGIGALAEPLLAAGAHYTARALVEALPAPCLAARPGLRVVLGRCALHRWDGAAAVALLRGAAADLQRAGDMVGRAEALVFLSAALARAGDLGGAGVIAAEALLLPLAPPRRVALLAGRAWQSLLAGAWPQAAADIDEALAIVERAGDATALPDLSVALTGFLAGLPGAHARVGRLRRLVESRAAPGERGLRAGAAALSAWAAVWRDDWAAASVERARALALLDPGAAFTALHVELGLQEAICAALGGAGDRADEQFAALIAALDREDGLRRAWRVVVLHGLARVRWLQGRNAELRDAHRQMEATRHEHVWPVDSVLCHEIGALAQLADGYAESGAAALRAAAEDQARLALAPVLGDPRWHLAHAHLQAGQLDRARAAAGPALAAVRREDAPGRLRWQGAALVVPVLRLRASGGPNADFAAAALARLEA